MKAEWRVRLRRVRRFGWRRLVTSAVSGSLLFQMIAAALPPAASVPLVPKPAAAAETLIMPAFLSVTLLPNGQVGLIFRNGDGSAQSPYETRFARYTSEHAIAPSVQLAAVGGWYPQVTVFKGTLVAGYVDPGTGKLFLRTSADNGATWAAESNPFGTEAFDWQGFVPRLVGSRDGNTLYLFSAVNGQRPKYRSTINADLTGWTAAVDAGDASMRTASANNCGSSAQECQRAHAFSFMETAVAGRWLFITKSDSGFAQSGRGTQYGTLGGAWSTQIDLGGSGGSSGCCGESTARTFLDRDNNIIYVRTNDRGDWLYYQRSLDAGASWGPQVVAYTGALSIYTAGAPVGLYAPSYTRGEYVWYAGFGGTENSVRVIPLWPGPRPYGDSGTYRLFGSAGGDLDPGAAFEYNFGHLVRSLGAGSYASGASDLRLAGRLLDLNFARAYNSADAFDSGPLGPAWTHTYNWSLFDNGQVATVRRGSGKQDQFVRNQQTGAYTPPPGVFDTLVRNPDGTYTLTTPRQTSYDFASGSLVRIREPAGNQLTLGYTGANLVQTPQGGTASYSAIRYWQAGYEADKAANGIISNGTGPGKSWQAVGWFAGDWWKVTWTTAQSLTRVRLFDFGAAGDDFGQGHLEFSDGSQVSFGRIPIDPGTGQDYRELSFPRKTGITFLKVVSDAGGAGWTGLSEVEAYDDESANPVWNAQLNLITDTVGRRVTLGYASAANLAAGKPYIKSLAASATYPDSGGSELTDGQLGDSPVWAFVDASWQGHQNLGTTPLEVTVDLGSAQEIGTVRSYYHDQPGYGMPKPSSVEVLTSLDNATYTSRGTTAASAAVNDANLRWYYDLGANVTARYVRLRILSAGEWLISSEIKITPYRVVPPGPGLGDRLTSLADPSGRKVSYGYDSSGRLTTVTDAIGNSSGQTPAAHRWQYAYDGSSSHLTTLSDPDGRVIVTNTYDALGRLATQKDGLLKTTTFGYPAGQATITDPRLHVTTLSYDTRNRVIQQDDPVGGTTYHRNFTYDGCGNQSSVTDRQLNRTDLTYDCASGNLTVRQEPQIHPSIPRYTTTWTYDTKNNPTSITDPRGFLTTNTYDPTKNVLLSTSRQIGGTTYATTKYEYADTANPGLATKVIAPRGNTGGTPNYAYATSLSYDASGNLVQRIDPDGNKTTFGYDSLGRQTSVVDPDGYATGQVPADHTWTTAYDANDRVTSHTDPLAHASSSGYDGAGHVSSSTDRNGNVTTYTYDAAGRLRTVMQKPDPVGQPTLTYTTTVDRDDVGNATKVTQANGVITDYGFDALNRLTSLTTHPAAGVNLVTSYALDGNGNTLTRTTADSVATSYVYDALDRLTQVSATGLATITYGYNERSERTSMSDGTGASSYTYDGLGRLTQAVQPNGTLAYGYDLDSNRTSLTYPGSTSVTYTYSNAGRLSSLLDWGSRSTSYTYFNSGLAKTVTLANGLVTTYGYDRAQRLVNLTNKVGATDVTTHAHTLDNEGNRTQQVEFVSGITTPAQTETFGYSYDGLNRLKAVTTTNPESFTLDPASNIASRSGPAATYSYDTSNRLTSDGAQSFSWSAADRLTARGSDTFAYDPLDRLTSSTVSGTARTYTYNGDGLLQSRTQGSASSFLWDPATSPSRLLMVGGDKIVYGRGPLYVVRADGTTLTFVRDGGKSVRAELNASGGVTASFRYPAYGQIAQWSGASTPAYLGYAGQLLDPSGLYYMRARWYDPATGRFVGRDPIRGSASNPGTLNLYTYALSNPIRMADPTGLAVKPDDFVGCDTLESCREITAPTPSAKPALKQTPLAPAMPVASPRATPTANAGADEETYVPIPTRRSSKPVGDCLATIVGGLVLIEASTVVGFFGLALMGGSAVVIPFTGGTSIPFSLGGFVAGAMLEGVAITGYVTAYYVMSNACSP